jgi:hypothetical protein
VKGVSATLLRPVRKTLVCRTWVRELLKDREGWKANSPTKATTEAPRDTVETGLNPRKVGSVEFGEGTKQQLRLEPCSVTAATLLPPLICDHRRSAARCSGGRLAPPSDGTAAKADSSPLTRSSPCAARLDSSSEEGT